MSGLQPLSTPLPCASAPKQPPIPKTLRNPVGAARATYSFCGGRLNPAGTFPRQALPVLDFPSYIPIRPCVSIRAGAGGVRPSRPDSCFSLSSLPSNRGFGQARDCRVRNDGHAKNIRGRRSPSFGWRKLDRGCRVDPFHEADSGNHVHAILGGPSFLGWCLCSSRPASCAAALQAIPLGPFDWRKFGFSRYFAPTANPRAPTGFGPTVLNFEVYVIHFIVRAMKAIMECPQQMNVIKRLSHRLWIVSRARDGSRHYVDAGRGKHIVSNRTPWPMVVSKLAEGAGTFRSLEPGS